MKNMEHMKMKWVAVFREETLSWVIKTDEDAPWCVADIPFHLPGDDTGERTAKAIVKAHNAALKGVKK